MSILETVALVIGTHFFDCKSDKESIEKGTPAARSVIIALGYEMIAQGVYRDPKLTKKKEKK